MKNSLIFSNLSVAMQRVQDAVNHGYTHHISGRCPVDKIEQAVTLFELNYQACIGRYQRFKRTQSGLGNVHLVLWFKGEEVCWLLLATAPEAGRHPIHSTDKLQNAFASGQHIEIAGFELVRLPKKGTDHTKLTWRLTQANFEWYRDNIVQAVRSRSYMSLFGIKEPVIFGVMKPL